MQDSLPPSPNTSSAEYDITPSPSASPSPASISSTKSLNSNNPSNKKKKRKRTVLVFLKPSKSKNTPSLFTNFKKKRRNSKLAKKLKNAKFNLNINLTSPVLRIHSAPTTPTNITNTTINMANVTQLKEEFESQYRRNSYHNTKPKRKSKSKNKNNIPLYRNNDTHNNPYKITHSTYFNNKQSPQTQPPPPPPYIIDEHTQHTPHNHTDDRDHYRRNVRKEDNFPARHHKSRSHVLIPSPKTSSLSRSRSPISSRSQNINGYNTNKYTGLCPHCNHESPLLDYITANNRHSYLTELRDKLAAIESLSSILKQQILQVQSRSKSGSDAQKNIYGNASGKKASSMKKEVSNPYQDAPSSSMYHLQNLTMQQQQALSLLTTQKKITFPLKGTAMISPQENISSTSGYFDKFKEMKRHFGSQEFFVGLDSETSTFTVHTKAKKKQSNGDSHSGKQYRQIRSFSSLNGAEFESAKDNVLKIWFKNTRGYFLISFASETEANTVLSLVNIIVNNNSLSTDIIGGNQLIWAAYIEKKGKRMRFYSQKFLCLIKLDIKLYKTHINYTNGEEPSQCINLLDCDLSRDKKEIKFYSKTHVKGNVKDSETLLAIKLTSEVERDDFLNLCAQTLGAALQSQKVQSPSKSNTHTRVGVVDDNFQAWLVEREEESGTDSELYDHEEKSEFYEDDNEDSNVHNLAFKSMTMTLRGPPQTSMNNLKKNSRKNEQYLEALNNTPRMYGAGLHKALDRLAKKRASDIDFIEIQDIRNNYHNYNKNVKQRLQEKQTSTYSLLDVLGKSMISGSFLNNKLYLHKSVWEQNKVMVVNYEKKLETFNIILLSLDELFANGISIDWLKSDFKGNSVKFHQKLITCEKKLREAQSILTDFINKSQQKAREKGAAKLLNKFKDKSRVKVFDNQPYRDLIYKICGHASSMQLYYIYLTKPTRSHQYNKQQINMLLNDIKGITLCMASFGNVVVGDIREFLFAYLRRGAKNIYQ